MVIPYQVTCLLRNLYAGQEETVRTGHGATYWFKIRKRVCQGYLFSPAYLTYMQSPSWEMLDLMKHKLESRLLGEISIISDLHHPYGRKGRKTKKPIDESERGEWKSWLKAQHSEIWPHHFMTNNGEAVEKVTDYFWGSKIMADGDCSQEIKRCFVLGRKAMTNLDSILKSWDITLPRKVHIVKAIVFLVVMYGCESWTIKKAEHWRVDVFALWCWRKL